MIGKKIPGNVDEAKSQMSAEGTSEKELNLDEPGTADIHGSPKKSIQRSYGGAVDEEELAKMEAARKESE